MLGGPRYLAAGAVISHVRLEHINGAVIVCADGAAPRSSVCGEGAISRGRGGIIFCEDGAAPITRVVAHRATS